MPRKGKEFELAYKWLYDLDREKYKVTSPAYLYDPFSERQREIDILVEFSDSNNINRRLAIECRDRSKIQDVTWIEQLQQKKEDLSLDYILATTTTDFTKSAINKARKHGVIIEKAETFNINSIKESTTHEFFFDAFFFKLNFEELIFYIKNEGDISFKKFIEQLNFTEKMELINTLNKEYYFSIEPHNLLKQANIKDEEFFQNDKDNSIVINNVVYPRDNMETKIFFKKNVVYFTNKIRITPFKLSLPLNKSLSIFEVEGKKNKKYRAIFGNDDDYVEIGYIEGESYSNIKLSKRRYLRFAGANMRINTIFPNIKNPVKMNWDEITKDLLGEFDLSKIL